MSAQADTSAGTAEPEWVASFQEGAAAFAAGRYDEAARRFQAAAEAQPDHPAVLFNLGLALRGLGRRADAAAAWQHALALRPGHPQTLSQLASLLAEAGRADAAEALYGRLAALDPGFPGAALGLGNARMAQARPEAAEAAFRLAVAADPAAHAAVNNLGAALMAQGRAEEAVALYRRAARLAPAAPEYHKNLGTALLSLGRLEEGFREYEWRRRQAVWRWNRDCGGKPAWDGGPPAGRTILVHYEQGLGDSFQFVRYLSVLKRLGARTVFECQPRLKRVLSTVPGIDLLVEEGEPVPEFDCHASLMSLPMLCGTRLDTVPGGVPYLRAEPGLETAWRRRLDPSVFNVGIHWQANGAERSIPPEHFAALATLPGVRLHSLQRGAGLDRPGIVAWGDADRFAPGDAFADDAALIAGLDLVVCCDSAVGHLAGAMGRPVFLILPWLSDWRWMRETGETPWYPRTRLFRSPREGGWPAAMAMAAEAVAALAAEKAAKP
ncbi:MAG TPA: tetratricopeptide repeat-containing glycosyltransferase family protein [Azospirillaceae bacterium]|nr:tetratricopeptide repeat-containing glycosyltransferase family protein [Azospirillaceae bacterium]